MGVSTGLRRRGLALAALLAFLPAAALAGPEPWSSIRKVGLTVGPPFRSTDGWLLVVRANLSGLGAISLDPGAPSSAPACKRTQAVVEGSNIYLTVISGPPGPKVASVCPSARIGELQPGTYQVLYRGPDEPPVPLKEVRFER